MKKHVTEGLMMIGGTIVFGLAALVTLYFWLKEYPDVVIWESKPIPQLLPPDWQGWYIVLLPIFTIVYGLVVHAYIIRTNGVTDADNRG